MLLIGYLGPSGTFSEQAALSYFNNLNEYELIPFPTIQDLLQAIDRGEILKGVVPIENSIEGAVNTTVDMLAFEVNLNIQAEIVIPVRHYLLGYKEFAFNEITQVLSHPQAIAQCRNYLHTHMPKAEMVFTSSTAEAVREVASKKSPRAAVGTLLAAKKYGLSVLDSDIQDTKQNETRFVVLGKEEGKKGDKCKTSLVFSTENKPGELYRILNIFSLWDVNMTKIISRPSKTKLGEYVFFIDLEGHVLEEDMKNALMMVQRKTSFYKLLGSYEIIE
ncbi:prephenate dehydratase [Defluviitalea saccharophila]|uniref:Prephenate dehydratase n=1 Tax=Defluviitalea saccharophila TaxID=879970 RepID=A0ABZ2Y2R3_9FIRM|nr:prephenate dehydratase [Candidatus Epulonipiscium sp.]